MNKKRFVTSICVALLALTGGAFAGDLAPAPAPMCQRPVDDFFVDEVWAKVASQKCITCHKAGGDAEKSRFVLQDPERAAAAERADVARHNREAFAKMARLKEKGKPRLLEKVVGGLDHGGGDVLAADSTGYRVLTDFVRRVNTPAATAGVDERMSPRSLRPGLMPQRTPEKPKPRGTAVARLLASKLIETAGVDVDESLRTGSTMTGSSAGAA